MLFLLICILFFLTACSANQKTARTIPAEFLKNVTGEEHCYKGFISEMSSLVPADAYYCGIFGNSDLNAALSCAKKAFKSDKPFIVGYDAFGIDSRYCRGFVRQANGQLLGIYFDSGTVRIPPDGTSGAFWEILRCKKAKLKPDKRGNPYFESDDCAIAEDLIAQILKSRNN